MRFLLDSHALLWVTSEPERLAQPARDAIASTENDVFVSVVSAWELAIKAALGKVRWPTDIEDSLTRRGYQTLGISFAHAQAAGGLPRHHRDPFDRMLIAQAQREGLTIVTRDAWFARYGVAVLPA